MNFAFAAILLFFLVLPGIALRAGFSRGFFYRSPFRLRPITEEVAYSLILSLVVHLVSWPIHQTLAGSDAEDDRTALISLLLSNDQASSVEWLSESFPWFASYVLITTFGGWLVGLVLHGLIRHRELDWQHHVFRFDNYWFYLFFGERRLFGGEVGNALPLHTKQRLVYAQAFREKRMLAILTAIQRIGDLPCIYRGIIDGYELDRVGNLETVTLRQVSRCFLTSRDLDTPDQPLRGQFRELEVAYLCLKYEEISNITVEFFEAKITGIPVAEPADRFMKREKALWVWLKYRFGLR